MFILATVISVIWLFFSMYFFQPVFAWGFFGGVLSIVVAAIPFAAAFAIKASEQRNEKAQAQIFFLMVGIPLGLIVTSIFTSWALFHSRDYQTLIGQVQEKELKKSLPPVDISNAPLVSRHMAFQVAQKKLSDIPALGSQVHLGEFVKQSINGKLYWVSFLEHSGFFQWLNTKSTPGYIKVSAVNPEDVELVTEVAGKKMALTYLDSAYFGDNAYRRIYNSGFKTVGITDMSAEIDDTGRPYIVASLYKNKVGFFGEETFAVAVLDIQTGEVKTYPVSEAPTWVDRVHPEWIVRHQISDWGELVNGWFNPSNKGKLMISNNIDLVYGEDGHCYFYAGISSVGKDNGIIGFMLVNSRTKETTLYYVSGASEEVAAQSAEDVMPEKKYHATNPLPFSVNGLPTYIMTLTDSNGIPRAFAMVNIQNYQILAVSDTLKNTYELYQNKLARHGGASIEENKKELKALVGEVLRVASEIKNGNTVYYLTLNSSNKIFIATSELSEKLVITKSLDKVKVSYPDLESKVINLVTFDNQSIP